MTTSTVLPPPAAPKSRVFQPIVAVIAVIVLLAALTLAFTIGRTSAPTHHGAPVSVITGSGSAIDTCRHPLVHHFC
jgi:hypothetical protein